MYRLKDFSVIYSDKLGMGYIIPEPVDIDSFINPVPVKIGNETIQPQEETTLSGYFDITPAKYVGMFENEMIFYLGCVTDLFSTDHYYLSLLKVTEKRIFSMFSFHAGRDFNLVKNKWK